MILITYDVIKRRHIIYKNKKEIYNEQIPLKDIYEKMEKIYGKKTYNFFKLYENFATKQISILYKR